jgi:hypothetical protein
MSAISIDWIDTGLTEPTEELFWDNMKTADSLHHLESVLMIANGYNKIKGNENKNYYDLEMDIRKHDLNLGLIADSYENNEIMKKDIEDEKIAIVDQRIDKKNLDYSNLKPEQTRNYHVVYSCRNREDVLTETLQYHKSIEENLEKLKEAGIAVVIDKNNISDDPNLKIMNDETKTLSSMISDGEKRMVVKTILYKDIVTDVLARYPKGEWRMLKMNTHGGPTMAYEYDKKIVCRIGVDMYYDERGKQVQDFVLL